MQFSTRLHDVSAHPAQTAKVYLIIWIWFEHCVLVGDLLGFAMVLGCGIFPGTTATIRQELNQIIPHRNRGSSLGVEYQTGKKSINLFSEYQKSNF